MTSRLNLLMKALNISGKELSEIMNIDSSLLSKWRTGDRVIKPKSVYADKIVAVVMERDKHNNYRNIHDLLQDEYENIRTCSKKELALFLKTWLTSGNVMSHQDATFDRFKDMRNVEKSIFYKFQGHRGRRQAIRFLNEFAESLPLGVVRFSYTEEGADWFSEDPAFVKEWTKVTCQFLGKGNKIKVIHPVDRTYETTANSMLNWLPLHLTGGTRAFYIPRYMDESIRFSFFLIPQYLVLFGLSSKSYSKGMYTFLTNDPGFLESIEDVLKDFFDRSIPIFKRYNYETYTDFYKDMAGILENRNLKYIYSSEFLFMPLSNGLIGEIMAYNQIPPERAERYARQYRTLSKLVLSVTSRFMVDMDKLGNKLAGQDTVLNGFSFIMGTTVSVSGEIFRKIIEEAVDGLNRTENVEVGIINAQALTDADVNILVEERICANFFSAEIEEPLSLVTKELTVVAGMFLKLEKTWDSIPRLKRNKEFASNQMKELMTTGR